MYKADLHIHTILSPCGDLSMSPQNIVDTALLRGLQIIGITDHNSTRQAPLVKRIGERQGLLVLCGCEITSKEEAHCLAFFKDDETLNEFQTFLDAHLPGIPNDTDRFGYQVVVDENEEIIYEEPKLLISALDVGLDGLYDEVHRLGGIFIPAHIDKPTTSLMSQLGFVPPDIKADGMELSKFNIPEKFIKRFAYLKKFKFIQSSDAHVLDTIGETFSELDLKALSFEGVKAYFTKLC
ncbi:MAG: PHP domain-containing protein [Bacteroidales bacterium]|jgi:predicted metal-dependent phosphoesterase TrpH|nr:PHP domain-containing protein [Bacteroidales bacterium]